MLVSEAWLREWVQVDIETDELVSRLSLAGLEVETLQPAGPVLDDKKVLIGQIDAMIAHPDSDHLQICTVNIGQQSPLSIICGARNASIGMKTVVARVGATLPEQAITRREIRGVSSDGMLCAAAELGLSEAADGILALDATAPIGVGLGHYLGLADQIMELDLTPNRGDCLSIAGVAREVAALTGKKLHPPKLRKTRARIDTVLPIELTAPTACPRYVGRSIMGVDRMAKTPDWMSERLRRAGLRSINAIVDITNYVMHELGQPMHAFDYQCIAGGIQVRMARAGEVLQLLDGSTVELTPEHLLIADHNGAIALAGIMGGTASAISSRTRDIYLEAAFFSPATILGKARQLGLHTDASHHFERGVDYALPVLAMERATELVVQIAGGQAGPITDAVVRAAMPKKSRIHFARAEITRVLGTSIPTRTVTRCMQNLGMQVTTADDGWYVQPPSWRFDIEGQHDLVEEVGRLYGYDKIVARPPQAVAEMGRHRETQVPLRRLQHALQYSGYHEVLTYSFISGTFQEQLLGSAMQPAVHINNPIADNMAVMRQSLWPGLLTTMQANFNRQHARVRLFESGTVFFHVPHAPGSASDRPGNRREMTRLAAAAAGTRWQRQWGHADIAADFFDMKGDLESLFAVTGRPAAVRLVAAQHPALQTGQCAEIFFADQPCGYIGQLHLRHQAALAIEHAVYLFELDLSVLDTSVLPQFAEISRFPALKRDLALLVDETISVQQTYEQIWAVSGNLLKNLELFDIYRGKNLPAATKSLAFHLTFQSQSSNLTADTVEQLLAKITQSVRENLGAQLRE